MIEIAAWQKCPVCDGTGLMLRPPWVAGDQETWTDTQCGPYPCKICSGIGLLACEGSILR